MRIKDRYLKLVEWSNEDQKYIGRIPGIAVRQVKGDDEVSVYRELCGVLDDWIEVHATDEDKLPETTRGKTYSGKFNLRVGKELHEYLTIQALSANESLNSYCVKLLRERSGF